MESNKVAIVCDFDGTVAKRDVGHCFFETYVRDGERREKILEEWKVGILSSRDCLEEEVSMLEAGTEELREFVDKEELDPYFSDFVDFCNTRKYEILILSDGLDYYIDYILMKFGLGFIDYKANHLRISNGDIKGVDFPYYDLIDCRMCGNCKRKHVEDLVLKGYFTVYVGNGFSDRCASQYADIIFAKDDLLDHCSHEKISHEKFDNFRDVERVLSTKLKV